MHTASILCRSCNGRVCESGNSPPSASYIQILGIDGLHVRMSEKTTEGRLSQEAIDADHRILHQLLDSSMHIVLGEGDELIGRVVVSHSSASAQLRKWKRAKKLGITPRHHC